jgi:hypothetical protein
LFLFAVLATQSGCAVSAAVQAAQDRDYKALGGALDTEKRAGELDDGESRDVARALAEAEIAAAKGKDGEAELRRFSSCAREVEGALSDKSEGDDDLAAAAADMLLSAGLVDEDEYVDYALDHDARPAFRALGARGLVDDDQVELRRKLFLDLDERVRTGALRAALAAPSADDRAALLEAARLDPRPSARAAAARALGRVGGADGVRALTDLWVRADGRLREAIVDAWLSPSSFEVGGRDELVRACEAGGEGSLAASVLLARVAGVDEASRAARDVGVARIELAIEKGTREERALAMLMAPAGPAVLAALRKAKDDSDPGIAALALARLAREGEPTEQRTARDALLVLAKKDDPEAARALGELAQLGDRRAVPLLEKHLASSNGFARAYAARALVTLGESVKVARLLADPEASVRADVACAVLREGR